MLIDFITIRKRKTDKEKQMQEVQERLQKEKGFYVDISNTY